MTADDVTARLLDRCGGVWIYLRYVLGELRDGARSVRDIDSLPGDLSAYYAESLLDGHDDLEWGRLRLPLLATLAVAAEPLTVPALTRLAGLPDPHPVHVLCGGRLLPFLAVTPGENDRLSRYSVYHASLREFLAGSGPAALVVGGRAQAEELARAAVDAHARIADYYLAAFGGLSQGLPALATDPSIAQLDDGYALRHLAGHLERAGRARDMDALLACQQLAPARGSIWYTAHERAGTLGEYRADLDRARGHAAARTDEDVRHGRPSPGLAVELRYLMIDSAVRTLTTNVPTELVGRLVQSGLWSPERGLFYARQSGSLANRAVALAAMLPYLPEDETQTVTQEAMSVARQVSNPFWRAWACSVLGDDLDGTAASEAVTEALIATAEVAADDDRAQLLIWLTEQLPSALLPKAARLGLAITDEEARARALLALIPGLPESTLPDMLATVPGITDSFLRGQMIDALASRVPTAMAGDLAAAARAVPADHVRAWVLGTIASVMSMPRPDLAAEAVAVARAIADPADRAWSLSRLAEILKGWPEDELLDEALSAARSAADEDDRFWALAIVVEYLPSSRQRHVLDELLKATLACPPGSDQTDRLEFLAPQLTKAQLARAIPAVLATQSEEDRASLLVAYARYLPDQFRESVLRSAGEIRDESRRGTLIQALAPDLPEPLLANALSAAGSISNAGTRSMVIAELAAQLPDRLLGRALNLVQATTSQSGSARFLLGIATRAEDPRRTELLREALDTARSATDGLGRAQALGDVAASLSGDERQRVLAEAVQAARDDADEYSGAYALDYLIRQTPAAQRKQLIDDAFAMTRAMSNTWYRAEWLAAFARYISTPDRPGVLAEALEAARSVASEQDRSQAFMDVAIAFPGAERAGVLREFLAQAGDGDRLHAGGRVFVKIARIIPDRLVLKALELARKACYEDGPLPSFGWLFKLISNQTIEEVLGTFRNYPGGPTQAHALGTAALYVPAQFRQQVLSLALNAELKVVARRAILTQAQSLWGGHITVTELEIFRQTITDIGLDDYLNVLESGFGIVAQVAGEQSMDELLEAFRTIQSWWPPPEADIHQDN
jgi:hypothetical protein